jgi:hypothetical protein
MAEDDHVPESVGSAAAAMHKKGKSRKTPGDGFARPEHAGRR